MKSLFPEYVPDLPQPAAQRIARPPPARVAGPDLGQKFEQMLWVEMLSHAGLEKAFTRNAGQAAESFSRLIVEAIARDIAEKHPLGLAGSALPGVLGKT